MIGKVLKIAKNPSVQRNVASFFKKGVRSKLAEHLRRTTIKTKGGKLRLLGQGRKQKVVGRERALQEGVFSHLEGQSRKSVQGFAGNAKVHEIASQGSRRVMPYAKPRGGLSNVTKSSQIGLKDVAKKAASGNVRKLRIAEQTVDAGELSKGYSTIKGHHNVPIEYGNAITKNMPAAERPGFWKAVNEKYPQMFTGDHWGNMRLVPEGTKYKHLVNQKLVSPHKQTHQKLRDYGLTVKKLEKMFDGKNAKERLELMAKIDHKMKRMDQWIFLRMKKWKGGEEAWLENVTANEKVREMFGHLSKKEQIKKIKNLMRMRRGKVKQETESAAELFRRPLDEKAIQSMGVGGN